MYTTYTPYARPYKKGKNIIKSMIRRSQETKYFPFSTGNSESVDTTGIVVSIFNPEQGTDADSRIGDKVNLSYLVGKIFFFPEASTNVANDVASWKVVYDKRPNGAVPTVAQLWQGTVTGNNLDNPTYKDRFITIAEGTHVQGPEIGGTSNVKCFVLKKSLRDRVSRFAANGAAITDFTEGSLIFTAIGSLTAASSSNIKTGYKFITAFKDG